MATDPAPRAGLSGSITTDPGGDAVVLGSLRDLLGDLSAVDSEAAIALVWLERLDDELEGGRLSEEARDVVRAIVLGLEQRLAGT